MSFENQHPAPSNADGFDPEVTVGDIARRVGAWQDEGVDGYVHFGSWMAVSAFRDIILRAAWKQWEQMHGSVPTSPAPETTLRDALTPFAQFPSYYDLPADTVIMSDNDQAITVAHLRAARAALATPPTVADGMVLAPNFRGYAKLGIGAYLLNHSAAGETPELIISIATEEEKAGRTVNDDKGNPSGAAIQPDVMAVRLEFTSAAGLDALEKQLRYVRSVHFAESLASPPAVAEAVAAEAVALTDDEIEALAMRVGLVPRTDGSTPSGWRINARDLRSFGAALAARALPAADAAEPAHTSDSACLWSAWWSRNRSKFTTARQASFAAWAASMAAAQPAAEGERHSHALAMAVLQSPLYPMLDDEARAECDALLAAAQQPAESRRAKLAAECRDSSGRLLQSGQTRATLDGIAALLDRCATALTTGDQPCA